MFDNVRGETTSLFEDDQYEEVVEESVPQTRQARKKPGSFLGMTPFQRFIISVMLLVATCILGTMFLLVTGRIGLIV
jgi:hypothetical protein